MGQGKKPSVHVFRVPENERREKEREKVCSI